LSVIPVGETSGVFARVAKRGVWQKLAQAVDAYCARRFERTVSDIALRRSKREIARCRQLVQNLPRCGFSGEWARRIGALSEWRRSVALVW